MADVFVSYARGDQQVAERIAKLLISAGFSAWWDSDLLPHNRFASVIEDEIRAARTVLVIWSEAATQSQWVRAEAELGREQGKLIQVAIDQSPIPLPFNQYQIADLRRWNGKASDPQWRKVLASVSHFKTGEEPASAAPAGVQRAVHPRSGKPFRSRRLFLLGAPAIVGLAALSGALVWNAGGQAARGSRISIQPFRTIGSAPAAQNFAAEVSDSLQNVLTQDQLQLISSAEAESLRGDDLASLSKKLGVGMIFSGTVETKGSDLAVSMRVDDPVQHATLWTAQLSGPATEADQLRAHVGALTVAVLNCSAQGLAPSIRLTDRALQAFFHACELSQTADHGLAGPSQAYAMLNAMRQATREAPDFAAGHSILAKHLAFVAAYGLVDQADSLRGEAEKEARRALELDPKDPDGYVTLGLLAPTLDFSQREAEFRKALATNPSWSHANGFLGNVMSDAGRNQDALTLYQRAASVNPQAADWTIEAAQGMVWVGQMQEADSELAQLSQLWPNDSQIFSVQFESSILQKRWGESLKLLDRAQDFGSAVPPGWVDSQRALVTALQGDAAARSALRQKLLAIGSISPQRAMTQLSQLGFVDDAFSVAQHYSPAKSDSPAFLFVPETKALRNDPRSIGLAARFGLIDYWRSSGHWPDFCSDPGLPYNCAQEAARIAGPRRQH